jgi:hypothetical protein
MYDSRPNLIIGFHGCEEEVKNKLINSANTIQLSEKPYDWLGHGMYFWENNYDRALQWAKDKKKRGEIKVPAVVGAVLHLNYCCDFLDSRYIQLLKFHYRLMASRYHALGEELPENKDLAHDIHKDKILRVLDCTTIEYMHAGIYKQYQAEIAAKGFSEIKLFDSTRGVFTEGGPAFTGAGIFEKSHIQICIRNPDCIQGFFNPRKGFDFMKWLDRKYGSN